jgi:hypothetical protein
MNLLEKPYTCPTTSGEANEDVATPEERNVALRAGLSPPLI